MLQLGSALSFSTRERYFWEMPVSLDEFLLLQATACAGFLDFTTKGQGHSALLSSKSIPKKKKVRYMEIFTLE